MKKKSVTEQLLEIIKKHGALTRLEIDAAYGVERTAENYLTRMREKNLVHISGWKIQRNRRAAMYSVGAGEDVPRPDKPKKIEIEPPQITIHQEIEDETRLNAMYRRAPMPMVKRVYVPWLGSV